jgi:hypothetical protein
MKVGAAILKDWELFSSSPYDWYRADTTGLIWVRLYLYHLDPILPLPICWEAWFAHNWVNDLFYPKDVEHPVFQYEQLQLAKQYVDDFLIRINKIIAFA